MPSPRSWRAPRPPRSRTPSRCSSIVSQGQEDLDLLPGYETAGDQFLADLEAMVAAGPDAFDDQAVGTLLNGSVGLVEALASSECDGYLG